MDAQSGRVTPTKQTVRDYAFACWDTSFRFLPNCPSPAEIWRFAENELQSKIAQLLSQGYADNARRLAGL